MTKLSGIELFNRAARTWDAKPHRMTRARLLAETICRRLQPTGEEHVMDYGCGTGLLALNLLPQVQQIVATDSSSGMLEVLDEKIREAEVNSLSTLQLDLTNEPAPDDKFDWIICSMTMHHVENVPRVLRAFAKLLVPGGSLALADLTAEDGTYHQNMEEPVAHDGFDPKTLGQEVAAVGFSNVDYEIVDEICKINDNGKERRYPWFLLTAQRNGLSG